MNKYLLSSLNYRKAAVIGDSIAVLFGNHFQQLPFSIVPPYLPYSDLEFLGVVTTKWDGDELRGRDPIQDAPLWLMVNSMVADEIPEDGMRFEEADHDDEEGSFDSRRRNYDSVNSYITNGGRYGIKWISKNAVEVQMRIKSRKGK